MSQLTAIQSAETLAALRALAVSERALATPCIDRFARQFLSLKSRLMLALTPQHILSKLIERAAPGSYCFAIARTRHFDEALLAALREGVEPDNVAAYDEPDDALADVRAHARAGDVVLFKGSRVAGLERLAEALR